MQVRAVSPEAPAGERGRVDPAPGRPLIGPSAWDPPAADAAPPAGGAGAGGPPDPLQAQVDYVVELYRRAGRSLRSADPADWAGGVTMSQFRTLVLLGREGAASVGDVAAALGVSQPTATETLDRLVRAGLARRWTDAEDRRVMRHALTEAGREIIDRPWEARRAVLASALRRAAPQDRVTIARGLELLCQALEGAEGADVADAPRGTSAPGAPREGRPASGPKKKKEGGTA